MLAEILLPDLKKLYRWKVALSCGHVTETMTYGPQRFPDQKRFQDPLTQTELNPGEMWCRDESHSDEPRQYRGILEWVSSKVVEFDADPVEPKHGYEPDLWEVIRHDKPHSSRFWRVRLACGHHYDHVVTDVDWTPEHGPRLITVKRAKEMRAELKDYWSRDLDDSAKKRIERAQTRKMLDLRWPRPEPEQACWTCPRAQQIEGYQRIGWLVPPPKPQAPAKTERQLITERLERAEAQADRLRRKLDELD
ncbi:hypothetical protein GCM10027063_35870 [Promicromonospora xylanilytica]